MKIIAEIGSNWSTLENAKDSIECAKNAGADAVKFQLFDELALYGIDVDAVRLREAKGHGFQAIVSRDMFPLRDASMPLDWLPKLAEKAKACGIEFMCTAFSPELVEAVDPFVQSHKVASAELTHVRLLEAIARTKKSVYLSTGASGVADIRRALEILRPCQVTLMHCVAAYPAKATNLGRIRALRDLFELPVGYSDHSTSVDDIPELARQYGATVLEKHVTAFPELNTPDRPHSLTMEEFRYMVDYLRGGVRPLSGGLGEERDMIVRHNRRLMAIKDIGVGETLVEGENVGIYRALHDEPSALSPWVIDLINGKPAKREIKAGQGIRPGDV
jgi:sialic acid synthase SpsE